MRHRRPRRPSEEEDGRRRRFGGSLRSLARPWAAVASAACVRRAAAMPLDYVAVLPWTECGEACASLGLRLPCVPDAATNTAIAADVVSRAYPGSTGRAALWLGYSAVGSSSSGHHPWAWTTSVSSPNASCETNFTAWAPGEPVTSSDDDDDLAAALVVNVSTADAAVEGWRAADTASQATWCACDVVPREDDDDDDHAAATTAPTPVASTIHLLPDGAMAFEACAEQCRARGATVPCLHSPATASAYVAQYLAARGAVAYPPTESFWLGFEKSAGDWRWDTEANPGCASTYVDWALGEPDADIGQNAAASLELRFEGGIVANVGWASRDVGTGAETARCVCVPLAPTAAPTTSAAPTEFHVPEPTALPSTAAPWPRPTAAPTAPPSPAPSLPTAGTTSPSKKSKSDSSTVAIAAGASVGAVVAVLLACCAIAARARRSFRQHAESESEAVCLSMVDGVFEDEIVVSEDAPMHSPPGAGLELKSDDDFERSRPTSKRRNKGGRPMMIRPMGGRPDQDLI